MATKQADVIERRLLDLAYTTDVKITAPALAYFAPCSIEEAARVLDDLAGKDRVHLEVEDDGTCVYRVPGRQRLGTAPTPEAVPAPLPVAIAEPRRRAISLSPVLAILLTVLVPGAGHLYSGRIFSAIGWFFLVGLGYVLILPGLIFHVAAMISAGRAATRSIEGRPSRLLFA